MLYFLVVRPNDMDESLQSWGLSRILTLTLGESQVRRFGSKRQNKTQEWQRCVPNRAVEITLFEFTFRLQTHQSKVAEGDRCTKVKVRYDKPFSLSHSAAFSKHALFYGINAHPVSCFIKSCWEGKATVIAAISLRVNVQRIISLLSQLCKNAKCGFPSSIINMSCKIWTRVSR